MTTTRTMMTTRRGKFSTASSVFLLCLALLATKSCGILALSGDGPAELPAQAEAWQEITTLGEGSGWEVTTEAIVEVDTTTLKEEIATDDGSETAAPAEPETTLSPSEPEETSAKPTANPSEQQPSEQQPSEQQPSEQQPSEQQPSEQQPSEQQPSEQQPSEQQPSSSPSPSEEQPSSSPIAPTPPAPPVFECQTAGAHAHISGDCQRFHNCLPDPATGELQPFEMVCPPLMAFSPTYGRCVRDVSSCQNDEFVCATTGRFAGSDDSFYYNCVRSLQGGFHKYIVRCSPFERFEPLLGGCWRYDWTQVLPGQGALEASDLAAIKREQKQFKSEEKLRLKEEKNKEKLARKQQKQEEKLAKKAAKEAAKKAAKANKPVSVESVESVEGFF